jgi:hypothetical protein
MTYNFDPELWFENMLDRLEARKARGEVTAEEFNAGHARLVDEYEKMLERLDIRHDYSQRADADPGKPKPG